jgi:Flp pilus assembly pilin Flp
MRANVSRFTCCTGKEIGVSAIAFLIAVAIALAAALLYGAIRGDWTARGLAATFVLGLVLLIGPAILHI